VRVVQDALPQRRQPLVEDGFQGAELGVGVRGAGVDDGAGRQDGDHRFQGAVAVLDGAAGHARGVVGDHAADGAGGLAGRVGAELASVGGEVGVQLLDGHARLDADTRPAVQHLDRREVATHVGQHLIGAGLAGQAGATGAEGEPDAHLGGGPQQLGDLVGAARGDHGHRVHEEVGRVMRHRPTIDLVDAYL